MKCSICKQIIPYIKTIKCPVCQKRYVPQGLKNHIINKAKQEFFKGQKNYHYKYYYK